MKRILIAVVFIFSFYISSFATFFVDVMGADVNAGDLKNETGFGGALGFDITPSIAFVYRALMTSYTEDQNKPTETEYSFFTNLFGIEFVPNLPQLESLQLRWRTSLLIGPAIGEVAPKSGDSASDMGLDIALWTGLQYDLTQHISPFFEIGYHKASYENDFEKASIGGYQIALGVRFYIFGSRDYTSEY
ncbi:MAG TPA: hypothetical protein PKX79_11355 [Spirochaetota bacterium]|nr:hypothetical protein [Spirochaetota bacterium]HOK91662.1 hypothetical protein [Spirochaetota bacterium]HPP95962.1 hypothetical protein [Spirochaetota bacterium]